MEVGERFRSFYSRQKMMKNKRIDNINVKDAKTRCLEIVKKVKKKRLIDTDQNHVDVIGNK